MNLQAFPLLSVVVLSFADRLWTWWGIAIMAASLALGFISAARKGVDDMSPEELMAYDGDDDEGLHRENVLSFFVVTLPAFAAAVGGHYVVRGWGALIGGVVVAFVCSVIFAGIRPHLKGA